MRQKIAVSILALIVLEGCSLTWPGQSASPTSLPMDRKIIFSSGLTLEEYALASIPDLDPLFFQPLHFSSMKEVRDIRREWRRNPYPVEEFYSQELGFGRTTKFQDHTLTAVFSPKSDPVQPGEIPNILTSVFLDGIQIFEVGCGQGSPINPIQGLWANSNHWVLETVFVKEISTIDQRREYQLTGQLVQDGISLNEEMQLEDAFGFQWLNNKPFYFFKKTGDLYLSYDGEQIGLGYDHIPHYGCCSAAVLNPAAYPDMVAFFAVRDHQWYYVEVGVYSSDE